MSREATGRDFDFLVAGAGVVGTVMASLLVVRKLAAPGRVAVIAERPPMERPSGMAAGGRATTSGASKSAGAGSDAVPSTGTSPGTDTGVPSGVAARADAAPMSNADDWGARVFALSRASQRLLELCGAWAALPRQKVCAYERMCVWDARGAPAGTGSLTFDAAELDQPNLGFIVEGAALQTQCLRTAQAAGVVLIETAVDAVSIGDDVRLRLRDGRELRGGLLLAADGTESAIRSMLRIDTAGHAYDQDALVAHVRTAKFHRNTAWQRFLASGPLAFLPLPDGRSSIVWSVARAEATRLRALAAADFGAAVTAASGGVLGPCELTTPVVSFPLKLQYALDYVRPRAVLLGDAAHAVHPLAGQGLNLGLLDCASLAEVLAPSGSAAADPGGEFALLRRYERWRRSENLLAATALDGLERLFSSSSPLVARLREAGLSAVGRVPIAKRRLAMHALGLSGDVPAFLREAGMP